MKLINWSMMIKKITMSISYIIYSWTCIESINWNSPWLQSYLNSFSSVYAFAACCERRLKQNNWERWFQVARARWYWRKIIKLQITLSCLVRSRHHHRTYIVLILSTWALNGVHNDTVGLKEGCNIKKVCANYCWLYCIVA